MDIEDTNFLNDCEIKLYVFHNQSLEVYNNAFKEFNYIFYINPKTMIWFYYLSGFIFSKFQTLNSLYEYIELLNCQSKG